MQEFLDLLHDFIHAVEALPRFRGQTQAIRALHRIKGMAVFSK